MDILYMGQYYEENEEKFLVSICKNGISAAHYKFQHNVINALELSGANVSKLTTIPVGNYPQKNKKVYFKTKIHNNNVSIGFINLPIIKHAMRYFLSKIYIKEWLRNKEQSLNNVILIYDCYIPFLKAALECNKKNFSIYIIVPDLPGYLCIEYDQYNWITKKYKNKEYKKFLNLVKKTDGAIVLTEAMADKLNIKNYLVMEAICETNCKDLQYQSNTQKQIKILYAGELSYKVGIKEMIDNFEHLDIQNIVLIICGRGEMENYIKDKANNNKNIVYKGFVLQHEMDKLYQDISILINPRWQLDEYTKYSFPSKNIEYLKTGKPVIAYKLPGIPDEYDEFLIYPKNYSQEAFENAIKYALSIMNSKVRAFKQREFVRSKNIESQGKRIIDFLCNAKLGESEL